MTHNKWKKIDSSTQNTGLVSRVDKYLLKVMRTLSSVHLEISTKKLSPENKGAYLKEKSNLNLYQGSNTDVKTIQHYKLGLNLLWSL